MTPAWGSLSTFSRTIIFARNSLSVIWNLTKYGMSLTLHVDTSPSVWKEDTGTYRSNWLSRLIISPNRNTPYNFEKVGSWLVCFIFIPYSWLLSSQWHRVRRIVLSFESELTTLFALGSYLTIFYQHKAHFQHAWEQQYAWVSVSVIRNLTKYGTSSGYASETSEFVREAVGTYRLIG